jgi:hypothetical protein
MKEVDVRDYYLISKKDLQKIKEFTRDGFFMGTINDKLLDAQIVYQTGFTQGCRYMADETPVDDDIDNGILFYYCTYKIQLP